MLIVDAGKVGVSTLSLRYPRLLKHKNQTANKIIAETIS